MSNKFNPQEAEGVKNTEKGRIQSAIVAFFKDTELFTAVILLLVALVSFRLGQLSDGRSTSTEPSGTSSGAAVTLVASSSAESTTYVGSKNSDKYHLPWCAGAQRIKAANKVVFGSKTEAEDAGYEPAANCKGI